MISLTRLDTNAPALAGMFVSAGSHPGEFDDRPMFDAGAVDDLGRRVVVQIFGTPPGLQSPRTMGSGTMGSGKLGGDPDETQPQWFDVIEDTYRINVRRGTEYGEISAATDSLDVELYDDVGELVDFTHPLGYDKTNVGRFIRAGIIGADGGWRPLILARIETVLDQHEQPPRDVFIEAFSVLTDLVTDLDGFTHNVGDEGSAAANVITSALAAAQVADEWDSIEVVDAGTALDSWSTTGSVLAVDVVRTAAYSAGLYLDTNPATGHLRLREWPLAYNAGSVIDVADRDDGPELPVVSISFVADTAALLNVANVYHDVVESRDSSDTDVVSINQVGRKSQALGFPLSGSKHAAKASADALTARAIARAARTTSRPTAVRITVDPAGPWVDAVADLDVGDSIDVHRTNVRDVTYRCVIVGVEHELSPARHVATLYLSTIDPTY